MSRLVIGAVFEKDTKTPKHQEIIGRTGYILDDCIEIDTPFFFDYDDKNRPDLHGKCLRSSWVEKFEENDWGYWIWTHNSVYRLDKI